MKLQPVVFKLLSVLIIAMLLTVRLSIAADLPVNVSDDKYQQEVLSSHNKFRANHHAPKLVWDDELAAYAERYASKCKFAHSSSPYGENLAAGYQSAYAAVEAWYEEHKQYSYATPGFSYKTGHFTQLVWRASRKLGCAYVTCNGKNGTPGKYLVCEYSPAGNIINGDYFARNILPA